MADLDKSQVSAELRELFESAVNRHGHPFQYAVIRKAHELRDSGQSPWVFEASEFPVEVRGNHTRIDFVLGQYFEHSAPFRYLVCECKRANPSLSNWLFVRAPYVRRGGASPEILVETLRKDEDHPRAGVAHLYRSDKIYHLGFETRSSAVGDASGGSRGAIEAAATQVLRCVNGLVECFAKSPRYLSDGYEVAFIPVVFTTAHLWSTEVDLGSTNIERGQISLDASSMVKRRWLWLQYHASPGLKHQLEYEAPTEKRFRLNLGELLETEYVRTIAIVAADGVEAFLTLGRWEA